MIAPSIPPISRRHLDPSWDFLRHWRRERRYASCGNQMLPRDLRAEHFRSYAPEAGKLAIEYLPLLRQLPLSFLPNLLRELTEFDLKFQIERRMLEKELAN